MHRFRSSARAFSSVVLGPLLVAAPALAREADASAGSPYTSTGGEWRFSVAPYLWISGVEGSIAAERVQADFEADFSDILDDLDFAVMGAAEARRDRLSIVANVLWLRTSSEEDVAAGPLIPTGTREVGSELETLAIEALVGYELASLPIGERRLVIDGRVGMRVWRTENEIDVSVDVPAPLPDFSGEFESDTSWVDFLLGWRAQIGLTDRLTLFGQGDFGGFDFGTSSSFTWSVLVHLGYDVSEHWRLIGGWRSLDVDRDDFDERMEGPLLAVAYRF